MNKGNLFSLRMTMVLFAVAMFQVSADGGNNGVQVSNPNSVGMSAARLQKIDEVCLKEINQGTIPCASILVARKGKIVYLKNFGYQDVSAGTPLRDDAIFRIASFTKAVTAACAMALFEEGKFRMNDPVAKYIPAFANVQVAVLNASGTGFTTRPPTRAMTVRDILTHKAGLIYQPFFTGPLSDYYLQHEVAEIFPYRRDESLEEYVNRLATVPLISDPGEQITYGVSADVLGRLIEVWSGMSYGDFAQERIFGPLGMTDTSFFLPDGSPKIARIPKVYTWIPDPNDPYSEGYFEDRNTPEVNAQTSGPRRLHCGGAGLLSTAVDYFKFCQMLNNKGVYKGARILSPKSVDMMTAAQDNGTPLPDFLRPYGDGEGFGLCVRTERGEWDGLESMGTVSFAGIFWTRYWADPKEDLVVIALTQSYILDVSGWTHLVKDAAFQAIEDSNL